LLWWPLLEAEGFVSPSRFIALAGVGDPAIHEALGVQRGWPRQESPEEFYREHPYKKIVSCTREHQWIRAQRGAAGVLFCSDTVLLEAGEPIYFIVPPGAPTRYKIMAGTSSLNRNLNSGCRLAGPSLSAALDSARKGLAFGREEIGDGISRLWDRKNDGYVSRTAPWSSDTAFGKPPMPRKSEK
jgi:hypothetical protein